MKRFINFCSNIKYLGLLGLLGLFFDNKVFDLLWLFWLFGFVEIISNFSVFKQAMKQLFGMLAVPLRYGRRLPNKNNYHCKVKYSLPFAGRWTAVNGGVDKDSSHSWSIHTQRYAYDFLILDEEGKSCSGDKTKAESYYCYGREILAPANGEVIETGTGCPDSRISGTGQVDCSARDIRGNYILIRHAEGEYSLLAHLQPGSIRVRAGESVVRGQIIALCGNSGNSSEPHLHFHLQNGISFFCSAGLPIEFENLSAGPALNYSGFDPRPVPSAAGLPDKYITRGQSVANI